MGAYLFAAQSQNAAASSTSYGPVRTHGAAKQRRLNGNAQIEKAIRDSKTLSVAESDAQLEKALRNSRADQEVASAIEASYRPHDMDAAMRQSQIEEETRQRSALREQQELDLQESLLMDQMRETEAKMRETEEMRRVQEAEEQRLLAEQQQARESVRAEEEKAKVAAELQAKRARVPSEPCAGEPGMLHLQICMPNGRRLRRAFLGTDIVGQVYDYVDVEMHRLVEESSTTEGAASYRLVSTMPRCAYEDRAISLVAAGLQGQISLRVETVSS